MIQEPVVVHHHKSCSSSHACRCASPINGGCPVCMTKQHAAAPFADLREVYRKK